MNGRDLDSPAKRGFDIQMKIWLLTALFWAVPAGALAANHAHISPSELVAAIKRADRVQLEEVDASHVTVSSVRVVRCIGLDEEPTEFECIWKTHGRNGWIKHKNWLGVEAKGWHLID